ncbi:hypothetical protein KBX71_07675 [Micromonospora sp. D93]|uniref:hypothetical protein n=1 Tax=Micromonospora sp. D93 TaxID=2824886 RepID=UPI001B370E9E|nr:hypothetical protein [Micromonospora sp. D93]MBQ1017748.1 hypothetical protein [Micromonospora sp. D93]
MNLDYLEDEVTYALGVAADWADEGLVSQAEGEISVLAVSIVAARNPELYPPVRIDEEEDEIEQSLQALVNEVLGLEIDMSWYYEGLAGGGQPAE